MKRKDGMLLALICLSTVVFAKAPEFKVNLGGGTYFDTGVQM